MGEGERLDLNAAARGLDDRELAEVLDFIGYLRIKRERLTLPAILRDAPLDDESLTEEDQARIEAGIVDWRAGRLNTREDVRTELGW